MPVVIDGTNGVDKVVDGSIVAADLASDAVTTVKILDANVTQAKLAANVAGNGPAFRAYYNSGTTTASAWTKVPLNTEDFDTSSAFDSTTNYRFQPLVAGYYQFSGQVYLTATTMTIGDVALYKNGTMFCSAWATPYAGVNATVSVSSLIYLNGSTDYVELFCRSTGASGQAVNGSSSQTFLSGYLARSA